MGSVEPLGSPLSWQQPNIQGTPDVEAVLDGPEKPFEHVNVLDRKMKMGGLVDEEMSVFTSMTEAVKEVATAIKESKTLAPTWSKVASAMRLSWQL
ncbi:Histone-lysine N-methyltransferase SUVR5 [Hordeum vulgare]|nr:Histone-lysine N-methyltransferase SUVR5 [Hordeum vulgare]